MTARFSKYVTCAGLAILLVVLAAAPFGVDTYHLDVLTGGVIYGLMAMGLATLIGRAGLPSLGHAAFVGVGGYAAAVCANEITGSPLVGLVLAAIVGGVLAVLLGVMSLRSRGVFFLMISLALAELVHAASIQSSALGGDNGYRMPKPTIPVLDTIGLPHGVAMYWYALAIAVVVFLLLWLLVASPVGHAIAGSRDNPDRMRALGYSVRALRMVALVASGVSVAVGGALLTQKDAFISPSTLAPDMSILLLVMVLVGGAGSLVGPFLAGVVLIFLRSWVSSSLGDIWVLVLGAIFVATVYFLRGGISGLTDALRVRRRQEVAAHAE